MAPGGLRNFGWNLGWFAVGGGLAIANSGRHRLLGYNRPRSFSRHDLDKTARYVLDVVDRWQRCGLDPRDRHILELGPGPDLGSGFVLVARGAASYTAIDRFPLAARDNAPLYRALAERLQVDAAAMLKRMEYVVDDIPASASTRLGHGFDAIVSNATLEHLDDVPGTFEWIARVVAPLATHVHVVDAQTHMRWVRPRDPWNILRYPRRLHGLMRFPGAPNRWLASDYLDAAGKAGIALALVEIQRADEGYLRRVRAYLDKAFRDRPADDLARLVFVLSSSAADQLMPDYDEPGGLRASSSLNSRS